MSHQYILPVQTSHLYILPVQTSHLYILPVQRGPGVWTVWGRCRQGQAWSTYLYRHLTCISYLYRHLTYIPYLYRHLTCISYLYREVLAFERFEDVVGRVRPDLLTCTDISPVYLTCTDISPVYLTCTERSRRLNGLGTLSAGSGPMAASFRHTRWYIRINSRWRSLMVFHTAVAEPLPPSPWGEASSFPSPSSVDLTPSVRLVSLCEVGSGENTSSCISCYNKGTSVNSIFTLQSYSRLRE